MGTLDSALGGYVSNLATFEALVLVWVVGLLVRVKVTHQHCQLIDFVLDCGGLSSLSLPQPPTASEAVDIDVQNFILAE